MGNTITINIGPHQPEEYVHEVRAGILQTLKAHTALRPDEVTERHQTANWYLLDLLERMEGAEMLLDHHGAVEGLLPPDPHKKE